MGEQHAQAAEVGDTGKDQTGADEGGEAVKTGMDQPAERHAGHLQRAGGDADLPLEADDWTGMRSWMGWDCSGGNGVGNLAHG